MKEQRVMSIIFLQVQMRNSLLAIFTTRDARMLNHSAHV